MVSEVIQNAKTMSEVFVRRVEESADDTAYEYEVGDSWWPASWRHYGELVEHLALGLKSVGFEFGERAGVWGDTMPEWTVVDIATMANGGCTAGIYQTNTPEQAAYIINDSGAAFVAVDNAHRLGQALSIRDETPTVRFYLTWGGDDDPSQDVYSYETLIERGKAYAEAHPGAYDELVGKVTPDTTAVLVYTSGTTGPPKGAMLSHKNCLFCCHGMYERFAMGEDTSAVSFLPLSHVAEHVVGFYNRLYSGGTAYFVSDVNRFAEVARLKGPTILGAVPRLYEKIYGAVMEGVQNASPTKRGLFEWAISTGKEASKYTLAGESVPVVVALRHKVADRLVLSKIRAALGGKVEWAVCGAAPIAPEIAEFFTAVGIAFFEVYGMTESSGVSHMNSFEKNKLGTVGTVLPGFECRIAEDGEILVRGDGVFQGYLNKPEATAEAIDSEGWLHTGDIGEEDAEGFLRITDRKKNLIITAGGKNVAPTNIELLITREPIISQVVVIGDRRKFLSALITVSTEELEKLGETEEFSGMSVADIAQSEPIARRVDHAVAAANEELARYENVRHYKILSEEFSIENGEMTPTMKLKRKVIQEKFADVIEGFYAQSAPPSA